MISFMQGSAEMHLGHYRNTAWNRNFSQGFYHLQLDFLSVRKMSQFNNSYLNPCQVCRQHWRIPVWHLLLQAFC